MTQQIEILGDTHKLRYKYQTAFRPPVREGPGKAHRRAYQTILQPDGTYGERM